MPVETINPIASSQYTPEPTPVLQSQGRWKDAFVPKTSNSWEGKPMCIDEFDENPNCCASGYDVEAIVEISYECGLQNHPGVKVLDCHPRPCVTYTALETLVDELAPMCYPKKEPIHISGTPKSLDISKNVGSISTEALLYCKDLVVNMISHAYGTLKEIPQKKVLGEHFEKVSDYCAERVITMYGGINVIKNQFPKKD